MRTQTLAHKHLVSSNGEGVFEHGHEYMPMPPMRSSPPPTGGAGLVELAVVAGRTEVVRLSAASPLRLLVPRSQSGKVGAGAWVVAGSYGGGLVAGDRLNVTLRCGAGTTMVLGTQASTKVYRDGVYGSGTGSQRGGAGGGQVLTAAVGENAALVAWPDPVTCFAGAHYEQVQRFDLAATGSLVAVDWLTSGRMARGERWAFDRYATETTVTVAGRLRLRESLILDPADGPLDAMSRTGAMACLGTAWIIGPRFATVASGLLERLGRAPIDPRRDVLFAVSPIAGGGAVIRFAGKSTESAWIWLREQLAGALDVVGINPWERRG